MYIQTVYARYVIRIEMAGTANGIVCVSRVTVEESKEMWSRAFHSVVYVLYLSLCEIGKWVRRRSIYTYRTVECHWE